jgi:hypothetical protein
MWSPSRCLETDCITPLLYYCVRVLLSNGCFCGSAVLVWSKYATVLNFIFRLFECTPWDMVRTSNICSSIRHGRVTRKWCRLYLRRGLRKYKEKLDVLRSDCVNISTEIFTFSFPDSRLILRGRGVTLTSHFQLMPKSLHHSPIRLHAVGFNYLSTGSTLPLSFTCLLEGKVKSGFCLFY